MKRMRILVALAAAIGWGTASAASTADINNVFDQAKNQLVSIGIDPAKTGLESFRTSALNSQTLANASSVTTADLQQVYRQSLFTNLNEDTATTAAKIAVLSSSVNNPDNAAISQMAVNAINISLAPYLADAGQCIGDIFNPAGLVCAIAPDDNSFAGTINSDAGTLNLSSPAPGSRLSNLVSTLRGQYGIDLASLVGNQQTTNAQSSAVASSPIDPVSQRFKIHSKSAVLIIFRVSIDDLLALTLTGVSTVGSVLTLDPALIAANAVLFAASVSAAHVDIYGEAYLQAHLYLDTSNIVATSTRPVFDNGFLVYPYYGSCQYGQCGALVACLLSNTGEKPLQVFNSCSGFISFKNYQLRASGNEIQHIENLQCGAVPTPYSSDPAYNYIQQHQNDPSQCFKDPITATCANIQASSGTDTSGSSIFVTPSPTHDNGTSYFDWIQSSVIAQDYTLLFSSIQGGVPGPNCAPVQVYGKNAASGNVFWEYHGAPVSGLIGCGTSNTSDFCIAPYANLLGSGRPMPEVYVLMADTILAPGVSLPPVTVPPVTVPPITVPPVTVPPISVPTSGGGCQEGARGYQGCPIHRSSNGLQGSSDCQVGQNSECSASYVCTSSGWSQTSSQCTTNGSPHPIN